MFAIRPNKYVFNKNEKYNQNIYKGLDDLFWKGYYANLEGKYVVDFVELGIEHRL